MKTKKFVFSFLITTMIFASFSSVSAFAQSSTIPSTSSNSESLVIEKNEDNNVSPQGIKRWITQQVLKATAKALRKGGSFVDDVVKELGGKEAEYFAKHTDTIADVLDDLAKEAEILEQRVIDQIAGALYDVGVPLSTARTIANVFTLIFI